MARCGTVILFPGGRHAATPPGFRKASTGTFPRDNVLSLIARLNDACLRPATMLRRCVPEQPAAAAISSTDIPLRRPQRKRGCVSDMDTTFSTRKGESQVQKFPPGNGLSANGLLRCRMRKRGEPIPRDMFLGQWMTFFDKGPTELANAANCSAGYISNMAADRKGNINVLFLLPISEALGITVNDLFKPPPTKAQAAQLQNYSAVAQHAILDHIRQKKTG